MCGGFFPENYVRKEFLKINQDRIRSLMLSYFVFDMSQRHIKYGSVKDLILTRMIEMKSDIYKSGERNNMYSL